MTIRMVNLTCPKCGMSLDISVEDLESYCPICGGKLFMSVPQVIDVLNQNKEIKRKDIKYATKVSDLKYTKKKIKNKTNFVDVLMSVLFVIIIAVFLILISYFIAGFQQV